MQAADTDNALHLSSKQVMITIARLWWHGLDETDRADMA